MTFDARAEAKKAEDEFPPWDFIDLDGNTQYLPHPYTLTSDQTLAFVRAEKDLDDEAIFELLEQIAPEAAPKLRAMPGIVAGRLMESWKKEVGDLGKSDSLPSTANRAARRSKPTSKSAGKTSGRSASTK